MQDAFSRPLVTFAGRITLSAQVSAEKLSVALLSGCIVIKLLFLFRMVINFNYILRNKDCPARKLNRTASCVYISNTDFVSA